MKHIGRTPQGEDAWELTPGFSWTLPHRFLPFADFNLHYFAVINPNCECTSFFLAPVGPTSESPSLRVVLGGPQREHQYPNLSDLSSACSSVTWRRLTGEASCRACFVKSKGPKVKRYWPTSCSTNSLIPSPSYLLPSLSSSTSSWLPLLLLTCFPAPSLRWLICHFFHKATPVPTLARSL